jgi:hypothetical protein
MHSLSENFAGSSLRFSHGSMMAYATLVHGFNLLLLNPLDKSSILHTLPNGSSRQIPIIYLSGQLVFGLRGVNTPWQVKGLPDHPKYLFRSPDGTIATSRFLIRQFCILSWQYLALDILYERSLQRTSPSAEIAPGYFPPMPWKTRVYITIFSWFIVARILADSLYRFGSLVAVSIGDDPINWPPLFGTVWDAYTLRGFWGYGQPAKNISRILSDSNTRYH